MRPADYPQALERAMAPVLRVLEEDKRRAPRRLWPLFDEIAERLFEPGLDRDGIRWGAGFDDPEIFSDLRQELGQPAWSYVRGARLETAARLLLETPIPLSEIARMVGWTSPSTFRGALGEFLRMWPSEYRRRTPRLLERVGPPPAGAETHDYWERMLAGELDPDEARALDAWLERLAPGSAAAPDDDAGTKLRRALANAIADALETLPFAEQRRLVRHAVGIPDDALFEELGRRSRGTQDPGRAVELALLGVDSLAANEGLENLPVLAGLAWARVGLARWRGGDLGGVEEDLERSARDFARAFEGGKPVVHPLWEAERGRVEAAFHWQRGRRLEALPAIERSVLSCQVSGGGDPARALVLRAELAASIAGLGLDTSEVHPELLPRTRLSSALADLEEARGPLAAASAGEQAAALELWVRVLVLRDDRGERLAALPEVRRWASALGDPAAGLVPWLEGHCSADPEASWREAREGFAARGEELAAARATLDLARHYVAAERAEAAAAEASRLAAALGAHAASRSDLSVLERLDRPGAGGSPPADEDLDAAEGVLRRLEWDRRARRALELAL